MATKFSDIFKNTSSSLVKKAKDALDWLKRSLNSMYGKSTPNFDSKVADFVVSTPEPGKMYLFQYFDPHTKATLPFYDLFPLIFFIKPLVLKDGPGFLGINMHYLPPMARATLLDALTVNMNDADYDDHSGLEGLTYEWGKQFPGFKECVKKYYYKGVKDREFLNVAPSDWEYVVMLPLQQWMINPNKKYAKSPPY